MAKKLLADPLWNEIAPLPPPANAAFRHCN